MLQILTDGLNVKTNLEQVHVFCFSMLNMLKPITFDLQMIRGKHNSQKHKLGLRYLDIRSCLAVYLVYQFRIAGNRVRIPNLHIYAHAKCS